VKRYPTTVLAVLLLLCCGRVAGDHQVVLVTSANSSIDSLSILDVRKIYLGINVRQGSHSLRGLRNMTDPDINSMFLQSVVAMSEQAYERRLISGSLQFGRPRPAEYYSEDALIAELMSSPDTVTYMWQEDAQRIGNLKILKVLWQTF